MDATCTILSDFYASTHGMSWGNRAGWADAAMGTPTDYCSFAGLACNDAGSLTQIDLYSNQLHGSLPDSLAEITTLTWLALVSNSISGTIPARLANLTRLTTLWLYSNDFSGDVSLGALVQNGCNVQLRDNAGLCSSTPWNAPPADGDLAAC